MARQPTVRRLRMELTLAPYAVITHIRLATDVRGIARHPNRKELLDVENRFDCGSVRAGRRACRACRRPIAALVDPGRHAEMFGQPEHRLHNCRPPVDGVPLHPERAEPAAGL